MRIVPEGVADGHKGIDIGFEPRDARRQRLQQPLARLSGRNRARGAGQQSQAEPRLELLDRLAQRRLRGAEPRRRPRETALLGHRQEPQHIGQVAPLHRVVSAD
jgi:hypothetical protein